MFGVKNKTLLVLLSMAAILFGCDKLFPKKIKQPSENAKAAVEVKGTVVARVNDQPITLEDLNAEVESFNAYVPQDRPNDKIDTRDKRIDYLRNEMVRKVLLAQAAKDRGLDRKEELQKALENFKQSLLVAELMRVETANIEVSSSEIEDYYNRSKEQLKEPEERYIREMVLPTESQAKETLIQLLQGADFSSLAQEKSVAASAKNGGDLGYIKKDVKSPQFDAVAFSPGLEVGKISNYFKGPEGYYILKLEGKREGKVKSLSELWDDIKTGLTFLKQQQKIEELIAKLSREAKIEVIESAVK